MPNIIGTAPNQVPTNADLGTMAFEDKVNYQTTSQLQGFRNRIINGDMRIDQRNSGAQITASASTYNLDRWQCQTNAGGKYTVQQNAGSVTPPVGFTNYLGCVSNSAYSLAATDVLGIWQKLEGHTVADFGWGTANAKTVTLSFWVYSSLTGTFGGNFQNSNATRNYPFTYSIPAANTWTYISVTIPGDTSGSWNLGTNNFSIGILWGLGVGSTYSGTPGAWTGSTVFGATGATSVVGTNGATFYITGVQLEKGSTATSFDYRPYGQELALCQRYYQKSFNQAIAPANNGGGNGVQLYNPSGFEPQVNIPLAVVMRTGPTVTLYNPYAASPAAQWSNSSQNSANARCVIAADNHINIDNTDVTLSFSPAFAEIHWAATSEL